MARSYSAQLASQSLPDLPTLRPVYYRGQTFPIVKPTQSPKPAFIRFPLPTPPQSISTSPSHIPRSPSPMEIETDSHRTSSSTDSITRGSEDRSIHKNSIQENDNEHERHRRYRCAVYGTCKPVTYRTKQKSSRTTNETKLSTPKLVSKHASLTTASKQNSPSTSSVSSTTCESGASPVSESSSTPSSKYSSSSPSSSPSNMPTCTCELSSCVLHNGLWDLLRRRGYGVMQERLSLIHI